MAGIPEHRIAAAAALQPIPADPLQSDTRPVSLRTRDPLADEVAILAQWSIPDWTGDHALSGETEKIPGEAGASGLDASTSLEASAEATGITVDSTVSAGKRRPAVTPAALAQNARTADRLQAVGIDSQARHLRQCHTHLQAMVCDECHASWYAPCTCKLRWCAICGPRKSAKSAKFALALFSRAASPRWMTLTMERKTNLAEGLDHLKRAFRNWRLNPRIRAIVRGGLYQIEIKPKADGWHIHLHALIDSAYLPKKVLWSSWAAALGQKTASVQINAIRGNTVIRYVTKYALKPADIADMTPAQLEAYARETKKRRLLGTWGTWYDQTMDKLFPDAPEPHAICPNCKTPDRTYPIRAGPRVIGEYWDEYRAYYWPDVQDTIPDPQWCDNPQAPSLRAPHIDDEII